MPVERTAGSVSLVDVLDRVLDRGLRFDAGALATLARPSTSEEPARIVLTATDVRPPSHGDRGSLPRDPATGA